MNSLLHSVHSYESCLYFSYDRKKKHIECHGSSFRFKKDITGESLYDLLTINGMASSETAEMLESMFKDVLSSPLPKALHTVCQLKDSSGEEKWYAASISSFLNEQYLSVLFTDINTDISIIESESFYDRLTGLYSRKTFCLMAESAVADVNREYAVIYFDIQRFKAVNDIFGMEKGDALLIEIARVIKFFSDSGCFGCRLDSDRFVVFTDMGKVMPEIFIDTLSKALAAYDLPFEITFNAGIYLTDGEILTADAMIERAILAQSAIKGRYTVKFRYFTESMRSEMLGEQEITGMMATALAEKHFFIYYQPQYNHNDVTIIGAEALVRWNHPEKGIIAPSVFIPIFEKNGFITVLDFYVFGEVCAFLRRCIDHNIPIVPVSSNFSRYDFFRLDFVEELEKIRIKYNIPVEYLRIEITESCVIDGSKTVNEVIEKLHGCGYIVEMDDFGSGYSSLNVLKDIDLDIIKLDMEFLSDKDDFGRSGAILSSVVKIAQDLGIPVIAEGVENLQQADFLRSIGCCNVQGFLYSRPLHEGNYIELISSEPVKSNAELQIL